MVVTTVAGRRGTVGKGKALLTGRATGGCGRAGGVLLTGGLVMVARGGGRADGVVVTGGLVMVAEDGVRAGGVLTGG